MRHYLLVYIFIPFVWVQQHCCFVVFNRIPRKKRVAGPFSYGHEQNAVSAEGTISDHLYISGH